MDDKREPKKENKAKGLKSMLSLRKKHDMNEASRHHPREVPPQSAVSGGVSGLANNNSRNLSREAKHEPRLSQDNSLDHLSAAEVDELFESMLEDMNLTGEKRAPLLDKPLDFKRKMLTSSKYGSSKIASSPAQYCKELSNPLNSNEKDLCNTLTSLRIALLNGRVSWVKEFNNAENEGLNLLLRFLALSLSKDYITCTLQSLRCIRALGNCGYGLYALVDHESASIFISRCLNVRNIPLMECALELLSTMAMCSLKGHQKVMEGLTFSAELTPNHPPRFIPLIQGLALPELACACLQLINVITSARFLSEETLELDYRIHLRMELSKFGINEKLVELAKSADSNVSNHVGIYRRFAEADTDELFERFEVAKGDLTDPTQVFQILHRSLSSTAAERSFLSILQHLLFVREEPHREHYYNLLDELVSQVVLQVDGVDIDPHSGLLRLDVEGTVNALLDASKQSDGGGVGASTELQKKLDQTLQDKQEAEAIIEALKAKLKELEGSKVGGGATIAPPPPPPPGGAPPPPPGGAPPPPPGGAPPPPPGGGPPPPPGGGPPPPPGGGPPPPPGMPRPPGVAPSLAPPPLPFGMKAKPVYKPNAPLKKANWDKVNENDLVEDSLWVKINESELESNELLQLLTENFNTKPPAKRLAENGGGEGVGGEGSGGQENGGTGGRGLLTRKVKQIRCLDGKSAQALSILLGSLKVPYDELRRRIVEVDEALLTPNMVEQLLKALPEPEVINQIVELAGDYNELAEPEQFCCTVGTIKKLIPRLKSILFKLRFHEKMTDVKPDLVAVIEAIKEVRSSTHLRRVLEMVLLFGNYLNAGSRNAQCVGFHLSFLPKLTGTKDVSGKATLLHFLIRTIEEKFPGTSRGLPGDLPYLERASHFSEDTGNAVIAEMKRSASALETDLRTYQSQDPKDAFAKVMNGFLAEAQEQVGVVENMFKRMQEAFKELSVYFAFDPAKYNMESMLTDMQAFVAAFKQASADIEQQREFEEKQKRMLMDRKNREAENVRLRAGGGGARKPTEEDGNVIDTLMESLKSGAAFGPGAGAPRRVRARPPPPGANLSPAAVALRQNLVRQRSRRLADR